MFKGMLSVVAVLAVVAVLGTAMVSVVSAQGPWWMQEDGQDVRPQANLEPECPADCPYNDELQRRNFVDENNDGVNDNAGRMGRWFESDQNNSGRGMMGRQDQPQNDWAPLMGGRWNDGDARFQMHCQQDGQFGPGMMMGRMGQWNQNCDGDCENERPYRNSQNDEDFGRGMGRGRMTR